MPEPRPNLRSQSRPLTRRQILQLLAAGAAGGALAGCSFGSDRDTRAAQNSQAAQASRTPVAESDAEAAPRLDPPRLVPGAVANRVLVLVELAGGNDGLSTVIPHSEDYLHDVRGNIRVEDDTLLWVDDRLALAPQLERLHRRRLTIVEGVGTPDHTLSHFAMERRWQRGDAAGDGVHRFGYLGRLADALDQGGVATGISVAGSTPWLHSASAATLSLPDPDSLWLVQDADWDFHQRFLDKFDRFGGDQLVLDSYGALRSLGRKVASTDSEDDQELPETEAAIIEDMSSEGGQLHRQLLTAADLITADVGIRVIHARINGFDTHDDHEWAHPNLLSQIDASVDGFLRLMEERGLGDRVLVATVSEFGRRVRQNGQGLDHGAASTMLVAGPVPPRILGEPSPVAGINDLDDDGNLRMTTGMDTYLGSLAQEWLGVEAASILPSEPGMLGLV